MNSAPPNKQSGPGELQNSPILAPIPEIKPGTPELVPTDSSKFRDVFVDLGFAQNHNETLHKIRSYYDQTFYTGNDSQRLMYNDGSDKAYIWSLDSNDIRSEGMSYGLMITVMMDDQNAFNKLWKFAKEKMQHSSGTRIGYFSWQLSAAPPYKALDENAAPDGEEYFAMALFFAAHRWGNGSGIFDYQREANFILENML
ncbi:MAG: glycosyl hydrolase family 8, partial [Proteobacteria bacterium]|nr:glycosyl hydrolase family 8 [Pseudomonadota bacterium]